MLNSAPNSDAIQVEEIHKVFRVSWKNGLHAIQGISLNIPKGSVYGLIGPNGAGKSTTLKIILGLLSPSSGRCEVFGKTPRQAMESGLMGYLPENPYFYKHLTGKETLNFYGKLAKLSSLELKTQISHLLELVGLSDAQNRRVATYSKGMLQRIGLAQALIGKPQLLILDEPTAGVDPIGSREIRDIILSLKAQGLTILLCSHLLEQVQEVCDRVGMIARGKLILEGKLTDLSQIQHQFELIVENCSSKDWHIFVENFLSSHPDVKLIKEGHPSATLEHLFLEALKNDALKSK